MEWVETTAKTIDAAREAALDQLGVAADEAEFDVIEEPRPGCSVGFAGRPVCGHGFARPRCVRSRSVDAGAAPTAQQPRRRPNRRLRRCSIDKVIGKVTDEIIGEVDEGLDEQRSETAPDDAVRHHHVVVSRHVDAATCASAHHHQQAQRGAHDDQ